MYTQHLLKVNQPQLHMIADLVCNVVQCSGVYGHPLPITGLAGQHIQVPHTLFIVYHELACKVQLPQKLQKVLISSGQFGSQQLPEGLFT